MLLLSRVSLIHYVFNQIVLCNKNISHQSVIQRSIHTYTHTQSKFGEQRLKIKLFHKEAGCQAQTHVCLSLSNEQHGKRE